MNASAQDIHEYFLAAQGEWQPVPFSKEDSSTVFAGPELTIFANTHACCGILAVVNADQVQPHWKQWEQRLLRSYREWKQSNPLPPPRSRDLFLVLILDGVSATVNPSALAAVANDTFGSRKILLEREHRTVRETLADLAFFSAGTVVSGPHTLEAASTPEINLDAKVLEDLSQRSPSIIFDGLLNDAYPVNHPRT